MHIDGTAARAARREGKGENITYELGGYELVFPIEYPLSAADLAQTSIDEAWPNNRYTKEMLRELAGAEPWEKFVAGLNPAIDDLEYLWNELMGAYGLQKGESSSSPDSSAPGGDSSKPNSNGSTTSTLASSSPAKPAAPAGSST